MLTQALRRPKTQAEKNRQGKEGAKKNIETDDMGDTVGRIHVGKQDLSALQTRKMKGLKKHLDPTASSADDDDDDDDMQSFDDEDEDDLQMDDMTTYTDDDDASVQHQDEQQAPSKRRRS